MKYIKTWVSKPKYRFYKFAQKSYCLHSTRTVNGIGIWKSTLGRGGGGKIIRKRSQSQFGGWNLTYL